MSKKKGILLKQEKYILLNEILHRCPHMGLNIYAYFGLEYTTIQFVNSLCIPIIILKTKLSCYELSPTQSKKYEERPPSAIKYLFMHPCDPMRGNLTCCCEAQKHK